MDNVGKHLSRLDINGENYYLHTILHDGGKAGIDMTLSDCSNAWTGSVTAQDLHKLSRKVKMPLTDYLTQTIRALTQPTMSGPQFIYQLTSSEGQVMKIAWKKHVAAENIKFQLGEAKLSPCEDPSEATRAIFELSIHNSDHLQSQISSLESDNQRLAGERAAALKRLEKYVTAKEELEADLFSKFVAVLNRKKSKLAELQQDVEDLQSAGAGTSGSSGNCAVRTSIHSASDSDKNEKTDSEYDTDGDNDITPPQKKSRADKFRAELSRDDSLILDTGEDIDVGTRGRRQRRQAKGRGVKKTTPAKPVIPRVPSTEKTPKGRLSTSRTPSSVKSSLRKSTSNSDNNLDPDELFDDLA